MTVLVDLGVGILGSLVAHPLCKGLESDLVKRLCLLRDDQRLARDFSNAVDRSLVGLGEDGELLRGYLSRAHVLRSKEGFELHRLLTTGDRPDAAALARACRHDDPHAPFNLEATIDRWLGVLERELRPHPELGRRIAARQVEETHADVRRVGADLGGVKADVAEIVRMLRAQHVSEREEDQKEIAALRAAVAALAVAKASEPQPVSGADQAWAAATRGDVSGAKAVFAEIARRKRQDGERKADEAKADLHEAAEAERHLGAFALLEDTEEALAAYRRAAELEPEDVWTWIFIARLERQAGRLALAETAVVHARDAAKEAGSDRDVMAADGELGSIRVAQGKLHAAEDAFTAAYSVAERLAALDPGNAVWQHDLSVSWSNVGDVRVAQGDLVGALAAYQDGRVIAERLAASDPGNAEWQRDLSASWNKLGDVRVAQGDLAGALAAYQDSRAIRERLAASDPGNAMWQRDLSVSWDKVGNVRVAQGDLAGALAAYQDGRAIRERLAAADPGNAGWQRDLIVSYVKLAEIAAGGDDAAGAAGYYRRGFEVARALAESGRLAPVDRWMVDELRQRLAQADTSE